MTYIKIIIKLSLGVLLILPSLVLASEVVLKSGRKLEGKIIEQTDKYLKFDLGIGVETTYYTDEVDTLDGQKLKSSTSPTQIIEPVTKLVQVAPQDETSPNSVGTALENEPNNNQQYHLNKYPKIGKLFHWGMNVGQVEKVLNKSLLNVRGHQYQTNFPSGGLEFDITFMISNEGLEALVLRFYISPEKYNSLVETLKNIYGSPSGVDTDKGAVQWKDNVNDTGIMLTGEKDGLYLVTVGMRLLKSSSIANGLEPGRISSLEGVEMGMSKEDFLKKNMYFEAKLLPPEKGAPIDSEAYRGFLTINLIPSEAFFEFNKNKLTYIMIYVSTESGDKDALNRVFKNHLSFLSGLYGNPFIEADMMVSWKDKVAELRYGLHPSGKFVVSWELLFVGNFVGAEEKFQEHLSKGVRITGNSVSLGNQTLIDDVISKLEQLETYSKRGNLLRIEVKNIRLVEEQKEWLEQWIVYNVSNSPKEYTVRFTLTPDIGGTDISIKEGGETFAPGTQQVTIDTR
jgi:hypothetical protein